MQIKQLTLLAASLALVQASTWADNGPSKPVEGGVSPPTDKPDTPTKPPGGGEGPDKPEGPGGPPKGDGPDKPVEGGKTSTTTASTSWADVTDISTPVASATTTSYDPYWGDEDVDGTTKKPHGGKATTTTTTSTDPWADHDPSKTPVSITSTFSETWSDYSPPTTTPVKPVDGGHGKPPGKPEQPVSGGNGKPPAGGDGKPPGKPEQPVSGGHGAPPAGGAGGADGCGVVTQTVTNVVTVTVHPGKPTPPPAPPVATEQPHETWVEVEAPAAPTGKPSAPIGSGYQGIVEEWRAKLGLPALEYDSKLEANAQDCADSSGGGLNHKLNPGSMAQVLAPGEANDSSFEHVFVGGWLCERPGLAGLDGVCQEQSKGWDYAGQVGHADILTSDKYTKFGCGCGSGIWACDLA